MLQYDQRRVLKWEVFGFKALGQKVDHDFGQGEAFFLLRILATTTHTEPGIPEIEIIRKSPHGSALDQTLFILENFSVLQPINWRLMDEANQHEIGADELLNIYGDPLDATVERWRFEVWAIRTSDTQFGRQGAFRG